MKRDIRVYLEDIVDSIAKIEEYTNGKIEGEFRKSPAIQDAVIRRLEIIGEAVKHIPASLKKQYANIPWKEIAGTRDVLIHEYFGVRLERIWDTIINDLPTLKSAIQSMLKP